MRFVPSSACRYSLHRDTLPNITSKFEVTKSSSKMFKSPYSSKLQQNNVKYDPTAAIFGNSVANAANNDQLQRQMPQIQDGVSR